MATAKDFIEFWLENSVHPDERFGARRGHLNVERLVDNLIRAADGQGFTKQQMEAELGGDIHAYIRHSIERQNNAEDQRLGKKS
jgi:hypothetical protein